MPIYVNMTKQILFKANLEQDLAFVCPAEAGGGKKIKLIIYSFFFELDFFFTLGVSFA